MSTVIYLIKKNSEDPQTFEAAGITSTLLSLRANSVSQFTFVQSNDWLASPTWPYLSVVQIIERTVDGETVTDVCRFVGQVRTIPRAATGGGPQSIRYVAYDYSYALQRCDYSQLWAYTDLSDGTLKTQYEPTVVLGEDSDGNRRKNGQGVSDVIGWAISRGLPVVPGTFSDGVYIPFDERDNLKCWDAIVALLRYTPDYQFYWDANHFVGSQYVPYAVLKAPADMQTVTVDLASPDDASFTPRSDLQVPGIVCVFRWTGEYDGRTIKSRATQTAGNIDAAERASLVFDLEGGRAVFIEQEVEVEDYPEDWTSSEGKAMLEKLIPRLSELDNWDVVSVEGSGSLGLPSRLVSGALPSWIGSQQENETFTVEITYQVNSTDTHHPLEKGSQKLTFNAISTDATTHVSPNPYRKQTEWSDPEPVPTTLAADLYASWNRKHYDGTLRLRGAASLFKATPGHLLRVTGGLSEWETMDALVQQVDIDFSSQSAVITTGTCGRLEADNLMALYRAARGRRFSYSRVNRDSGDASDGNKISGATGTPNDLVSDGTPPHKRTYFAVEAQDTGSRLHQVIVDPASISFATSGNAAAQTLQIREMVIPYLSNGAVKGKLAQVLCGSGYGSELTLGGRGSDPSSPTEIGQSTEGSETASTTTFDGTASNSPGLKIWVVDRVVFNEAGDKKLYAYVRPLTFPAAIAPTVGAETRIEVDAPQ